MRLPGWREIAPDDRWEWLTSAWADRYPGGRPVGYELRDRLRSRWVRFHSLPESKRYPESAAERAEVVRRHRDVLADLHAADGELVVVLGSWSPRPRPRVRERPAFALEPTSWRSFVHDRDAGGRDWWTHLFVALAPAAGAAIDDLLLLVADELDADVILTDSTLAWLYHPYDGGADVIAASVEERAALADRHASWVAPRVDGL
ncbi:DUF3885 domain-containing protein [Nocardioides alkalitolerans]|uniref:DUF3885 domain-containing protein n=1 Tax=Nocardioides alkalitolerans TaxID=281714 RepID=UPI000422729E|nr:hypothetical protein [Nocardioides alkalitolerans]